MSNIEIGLCRGNYFDYQDDDIAKQREFEIADGLSGTYTDPTFPPDARSLYFDPSNPPKGALPQESVVWCSICDGQVIECDNPVLFASNLQSSHIYRGSLGDEYFVNALRMLACKPDYLKRLLVSDKYASKGLYTWKICKAGKWRYIHIDDKIPCRQSGRVNFCRNKNPNETFAMLIEKVYAKLHGCYEGISFGHIDILVQDLTYAGHCKLLRSSSLNLDNICDQMWDLMEAGIDDNNIVCCGRWIPDPYGEHASVRKGLSIGIMYEVMDIRIVYAEPTDEMDEVTVGMVCIRNLQKDYGRYVGRWTYGDENWVQYPMIGKKLLLRTRELEFMKGRGPDPNNSESVFPEESDGIVEIRDDEPDDLNININQTKKKGLKILQPVSEDIQWIQIEDFVDVFNRIYVLTDNSMINSTKYGNKRYVSKWVPGDFLAGSGGPPVYSIVTPGEDIYVNPPVDNELTHMTSDVDDSQKHSQLLPPDNPPYPSTVIGQASESRVDEKGLPVPKPHVYNENNLNQQSVVTTDTIEEVINDNFSDNPMYPFSISDKTTVTISLFQEDRRWSVGRLGEEPRDITSTLFSSRSERLEQCMRYDTAIGFAVMKLNGLKMRVTDYKLKKIVGSCDSVNFLNVASAAVKLGPGRYCIVPYTQEVVNVSTNYILHCGFESSKVEFEINNILEERPVDTILSDDSDDSDDDDEVENEEEWEETAKSIKSVAAGSIVTGAEIVVERPIDTRPPAQLYKREDWEYTEDTEENGLLGMFNEVGDLARYVKTLRLELKKLQSNVVILENAMNIKEEDFEKKIIEEQALIDDAEASKKPKTPNSSSGSRKSTAKSR